MDYFLILYKTLIKLDLGTKIRARRKALKMTAEQLADHLGVNRDNLYKWEKGTKPSDPEDFVKINAWLEGKLESIPIPPEATADEKKGKGNTPIMELMAQALADFAKADKEKAEGQRIQAENYRDLIAILSGSNSGLLLREARDISMRQKAMGEVLLSSLERLEKKEAGELIGETNKRILALEEEASKRDNDGEKHS